MSPLYYIDKKSEEEIAKIITKEAGWKAVDKYGLTKHFDCIAEPFSNFIREHRFGYSRRICHYSTAIRMCEMTREEALEWLNKENPRELPETADIILDKLEITKEELRKILKVRPFVYEKHCFKSKAIFKTVKYIKRKLSM